ncbi:MAG: hypothetical protein ACFFFH_09480 [Candidatus Thorarchaeota archaeon]
MDEKSFDLSDDSSTSNFVPVSHSQKYRKFIASNALIFFIARVVSIIYVYVVARLIVFDVMAAMIIISTFQNIFINIIPLGFSYAALQWTLSDKSPKSIYLKNYYSYTFFVSFPIMIFSSLALLLYIDFPMTFLNIFLYVCSGLLAYFLEVLRNTEVALYNTDKSALLSGLYSILNSIFVPFFYFFLSQDLFSVLLAWVIALILVISWDLRQALQYFCFQIRIAEWKRMLIFALPVWITTIINILSVQINRIFIYEFFDDASLNTFHWVDKNLTIGLQFVSLVLTGVYSLLVKLRAENYEKFENVSRAMLRMVSVLGFLVFLTFLVNAEFIVAFLLGEKFLSGIAWMKILSLAYILQSVIAFLLIRFLANENRIDVIVIRGGGLFLRIFLALIFLELQINGLLLAILLSALFTLVLFIARGKEFHQWNKHHFLRFSTFLLSGLIIAIVADVFLVWPLNNLSLIMILLFMFLFRPFESQDIDYIERVLPKMGYKYIKPFLKHLSYSPAKT